MRAGHGVDQLRRDTQPVTGFAHGAVEHVTDAELAPDLLHVDDFSLVGDGRTASDHEQPTDAGQGGNDVLDHPVDEVVLLWIAVHVLERQHGKGWLVRDRRSRDFHHLADETDALAGEGADQALCRPVVADCPTRRVDPRGQRRFRDDPSAPYRFDQIVLADHSMPLMHEKRQQIEDLGFNCDQLTPATQFAALDVESMVAKRQNHADPPGGSRPVPATNRDTTVRRKKADRKVSCRAPTYLWST